MEIHNIKNFLELAETEHVSKTADILNISQPSLSKSIAALESELGVKLFDRLGNRIRLNENGVRFAEYARQSMQMLDSGIRFIQQNNYEILGSISIMCWCFAPIVQMCATAYSQLNPYINFMVSQNGTAFSEVNDKTDFILCADTIDASKSERSSFWVSQKLFNEEYVLVAAPGYIPQIDAIPADQERIDLALVKEANFVTMFQSNIFFRDITYELCQNAGFYPKTYCQTDDFMAKMAMVRTGIAIAFLPESCLEYASLLCPGLRHFHLENRRSQRTVYLLRPRKALMSEAAADFYEFLLDYFHLPPDTKD